MGVFPNPASDFLTVQFSSEKNRKIELISTKGIILKRLNSASSQISISLEELPKGVYFIKAIDSEHTAVRRIEKQ